MGVAGVGGIVSIVVGIGVAMVAATAVAASVVVGCTGVVRVWVCGCRVCSCCW